MGLGFGRAPSCCCDRPLNVSRRLIHSGMATLRFHTAGESHGPGLISLIEGVPSGLELSMER